MEEKSTFMVGPVISNIAFNGPHFLSVLPSHGSPLVAASAPVTVPIALLSTKTVRGHFG